MIPIPPSGVPSAVAADDDVETLRREVADLKRRDEENRARMVEMEKMLRQLLEARGAGAPVAAAPAPASSPAAALDAALAGSAATTAAAPAAPASSPTAALDAALAASSAASAPASAVPSSAGTVPTRPALWSVALGGSGAQARLIDLSLTTNIAAGGSTVQDDEVAELQGGAHDPNENGFTLQQAELALEGAVDPYFSGSANIVATPGGLELEEAFLFTNALPWGLQVEAGYSLTEFGRVNPEHAHAWHWMDQPVVNSRMFGGEGLRSPGMRVGWLMPTPFFSELHLGVQNADLGDLTASFIGGEGVGGRPNVERDIDGIDDFLWLGRWNASWDLSDWSAVMLGASMLYGPNATGGDGKTWIYGGDLKIRWRDRRNFRGWPFFIWQSEVIARDYTADWYIGGTAVGGGDDGHGHDHGHDHGGSEEEEEPDFPNDLPADTLHDIGFYSQALWGFHLRWAAGLRGEYATGSGPSVADGVLAPREDDPLRADRWRISPLLLVQPTEFSRLRLQYNYDRADSLSGGDAHSVWVGAEILYGTHGAHEY